MVAKRLVELTAAPAPTPQKAERQAGLPLHIPTS